MLTHLRRLACVQLLDVHVIFVSMCLTARHSPYLFDALNDL